MPRVFSFSVSKHNASDVIDIQRRNQKQGRGFSEFVVQAILNEWARQNPPKKGRGRRVKPTDVEPTQHVELPASVIHELKGIQQSQRLPSVADAAIYMTNSHRISNVYRILSEPAQNVMLDKYLNAATSADPETAINTFAAEYGFSQTDIIIVDRMLGQRFSGRQQKLPGIN